MGFEAHGFVGLGFCRGGKYGSNNECTGWVRIEYYLGSRANIQFCAIFFLLLCSSFAADYNIKYCTSCIEVYSLANVNIKMKGD